MKSLLSPFSSTIFLFCIALLMISTNTPTCLCNDDYDLYTKCNKTFNCGNNNITKHLKWPFSWGENTKPYCGGIAYMVLTCEENVPKMRIGDIKYRILEWNNTTLMLKVARDDYWDGNICAVTNYQNSTFETTYFQRADQSASLKLLYNCAATTSLPNKFYSISCGAGDTTVVYTTDPSTIPCSTTTSVSVTAVIIPLLGTQVASRIVSNNSLTDAIEEGFQLRYTGNQFAVCEMCSDSGGVCGNERQSGDFRCFCKDGPQNSTCKSPEPTSSISPEPTSSTSPIFEPKTGSKSNRKRNLWLIVTGGSVAGFGIAIFFIVIVMKRGLCGQKMMFWKRGKLHDHDVKNFMLSYDLFTVKRYNYADLKRITNSFTEKIGQGGYGVVYKGCLPDGRLVAVKVISESKASGEDFINEVASIGRTSHINIVSLLGFCYEVDKRALLFEFMPKGSLDKFIYKNGIPNAICDFDWNTLFQIAVGIAQGLDYLHQGCITRILHLDIKPQNILLDADFCPKISDFGLAKICQKKESIVSIPGTRGTIGYMAPEVFSRAFGGVSHKSDVYSYGMLILEMIGGRNNHDTGGSHTTEMYFPDWIYKDLEQGNTLANCLTFSKEENENVKKITMVSLWCIQTNPLDRPSMKKVIDLLEGPLESVPYPPKPVLYSPKIPPLQISSMSSGSLYKTNSITT